MENKFNVGDEVVLANKAYRTYDNKKFRTPYYFWDIPDKSRVFTIRGVIRHMAIKRNGTVYEAYGYTLVGRSTWEVWPELTLMPASNNKIIFNAEEFMELIL
jgi:hypothetical protein